MKSLHRLLVVSALLASGAFLRPAPAQSQGNPGTPKPEKVETGVDLSKLRPKKVETPAPKPAAEGVIPIGQPPAGQTPPAQGSDAPKGPPPKVEWEGGEVDFGELVQGQVVDHTFKLSNTGEGDLIINQAKPSCGCTLAETNIVNADGTRSPYVTGNPIKPGNKFEVSIHFNTQNKRDEAHGQVTLYCNDPRSVINLTFKAHVKPFMVVEPTYLNLEKMATTDVREGFVTVKSPMVPKFKLSVDPNTPPEMKVEIKPKGGDLESGASEYEIHVKLGPNVPEGTYNRQIRLITDHPIPGAPAGADGKSPMQETQVLVMAQVTGMVSVDPQFISYGLMRPGQVASRTLRVTCNDPAFTLPLPKLTLTNLKGEPFEYDANMSKLVKPVAGQEGKAYDIELTVTGMPESLNGNFIGSLVIETGHPGKPKAEVRFTGVCRAGAPEPAPAPVVPIGAAPANPPK